MDLNGTKTIALIVLIVITAVLGFIPIWLVQRGTLTSTGSRARKRVLDFFNCFAGGVFLSTSLLHLLAEGREEMEEYFEKVKFESDFPVYETIAAVGLFLVAAVERIGFALMTFSRGPQDNRGSTGLDTEPLLSSARGGDAGRKANYGSHSSVEMRGEGGVKNSGTVANGVRAEPDVRYSKGLTSSVEFRGGGRSHASLPPGHTPEVSCDDQHTMAQPTPSYLVTRDGEGHHQSGHSHHHHHQSLMASTSCEAGAISKVSGVRALLLLIALSFHTVFDGLAVGLQESKDSVWEVFTAISVHKALVAFCLGLELAEASPHNRLKPYILIFIFSLISPIGIGIGMGVTSGNVNELAELLTSSVLQALATGTFLYVTFFEILGQQFAHSHSQEDGHCIELLKVLVTAVGFAAMAGVKLLDKD